MRVLIGWDDAAEAELLRLYLENDAGELAVALTADALYEEAGGRGWDAIFLAMSLAGSVEQGFAAFERFQKDFPETPVVLACREEEMLHLPRFLNRGLRSYLIRDRQGQFVFLALSCLESAVAAVRAEQARRLAERLQQEVEAVRRLQESIIPKGFMAPSGYQTAARYEPSQVTVLEGRPVVMAGGDYYDLFCPDPHTLVVLLGDASGHGLKACMSIMAMHTLIRMIPGDQYRDTATFVREINRRLCENSIVQNDGAFITLFYAAIDTRRHEMSWTSAGHPLPLLHLMDTDELRPIGTNDDGGMPLGVWEGADYSMQTVALPAASRLLLYTDGLTDALSPDGPGRAAFGIEGVGDALRGCSRLPLDQTLDRLLTASHAFTGGPGRHDDTSVVLLERLAQPAGQAADEAVARARPARGSASPLATADALASCDSR